MNKRIEEMVDELAVSLLEANDSELVLKVFKRLKEEFCDECGIEQPKEGRPCQCWNDE